MIYKIIFSESFEHQLRRFNLNTQKRILEKLDYLALNSQLAKKLSFTPKNLKNLSKYRVGNLRILLVVDHKNTTLFCYELNHRGKIYKNFY
mgnify:CR=1 FL=1